LSSVFFFWSTIEFRYSAQSRYIWKLSIQRTDP
jgi:hypothetical protein